MNREKMGEQSGEELPLAYEWAYGDLDISGEP